ncbi:PBECR4 domain-containing protein [Streptococcus sp. S784/96/1]|uniref:PBECR4 domain-containing protein n=1 Tax=Streptococcus sp. S784/96/1 TaxID=2653499 RepID=UPI001386AC3D|nr:PBECR4 domain-containing protein [Streptococcus sp. S784/96/1]
MAFTPEQAKALSILDVAQSLGMEMKRRSSQEYYWIQHDSLKINTRKNRFSWYSRDIHGDVITLVETIKGVSYKEAMHFLQTGDFPEMSLDTTPKEPFHYTLAPYEQDFTEARVYLKEQRGLSDETINFFGQQGVLAQAIKKAQDGYLDPVVVFKHYDRDQKLVGASLQGIIPNQERHEGKGYLKQTMYNSDGLAGLSVDIGTPNRLVFAEAPIDLMSYYELHKDRLENVRLVAMEGLKEQTISRYFMELYAELSGQTDYKPDLSKVGTALETAARTTTFFNDPENTRLITLAIDNDKAGRDFIEKLEEKGVKVVSDLPPLTAGDKKMDWNEYLKESKGMGLKVAEEIEKAPDQSLELGNAGDSHRNPDSLREISLGAASKPVEQVAQPDFPVITPLQFSIQGEYMSTIKQGYHVISPGELNRLNKFAPGLQSTAQWYRDELSGSDISYFYSDGSAVGHLKIKFTDENFAHLTGISPKGVDMKQVVHDFAIGRGNYGNIQVSNAIKDKSMVLPLLPDILSSQAFVFSDLSDVEKFQRINLSQAIKTEDEDLLLAIRDVDGIGIPASIMRIKEKLEFELEGKEKVILGVYRNRDGQIDQLSINETYIKDGGVELMAIMNEQTRQLESQKKLEDNLNHFEQITAERQLDSDGDGISNDDEIRLGTDPYNANSRPGREKEDTQTDRIDMTIVSDLIATNDTAGLREHLRHGMRQYMNSDQYKVFLNTMAKFHDYSSNNVLLMLAQNPEISHVASYQKWKTDFDRQVKKGEKGLKIWIPFTVKLKDEHGQPKLDENGQEMTFTRFKFGTVFDVSQTDGKSLPKAIYNLDNDVLDYQNLYRATRYVSEQNGVSISFEQLPNSSANGYYNPVENNIVLADKQMSEAQIMKTLFHEMAHADLHRKGTTDRRTPDYAKQELQAESIAYVVASHYGIDTSSYSFAYLANWARHPEGLKDFEDQLKVVQAEAKSLINRIDNALVLVKNKTLTQDKFQSKLAAAKSKEQTLLQSKGEQELEPKKLQDLGLTKS